MSLFSPLTPYYSLLKLVRPFNLAVLFITLYFLRLFILEPNFNKYGIAFTLHNMHFFLLVLSVVFICAGGYVINDYYDIRFDSVNKPHKQIVAKTISHEHANITYLIITLMGIAIGIYLSIYVQHWKLSAVHAIAVLLLFFYSYSYKKIALIGNFVVSFLTALSILAVAIFEPTLYYLKRPSDYYAAGICWFYILGISIFAFLLTMVREIVKDIEDMEGDGHFGARTVPVIWGINAAKGIASAFIFAVIGLLIYAVFQFEVQGKNIYMSYMLFLVLILIASQVLLFKATLKQQFAFISKLLKFNMLAGVCFMPLYYLIEFL